jgi:hypothetical protein
MAATYIVHVYEYNEDNSRLNSNMEEERGNLDIQTSFNPWRIH